MPLREFSTGFAFRLMPANPSTRGRNARSPGGSGIALRLVSRPQWRGRIGELL